MRASSIIISILFKTGQILYCLVHIRDNQFIIIDDRSLLRRNRIVIATFKIFITDKRYPLCIKTVTISNQEMSPSTREVSFTETSLFNITQSGAFPFLKQLLYYPVGTCHHFVHSIKNSTQRGFVSCIFQCSKCWKITGLSPHNVARGTLFPKQFASIYSFLMKSFIQCIYSINSLQVIGKISRCSSISLWLHIKEVTARTHKQCGRHRKK